MDLELEASPPIGCTALLQADWARLGALSGVDWPKFTWKSYFSPRFTAVVLIRLANTAYKKKWRRLAKIISFINFLVFNIEVPARLEIGPGIVLPHPQGVILGASRIGSNVTIFQQVTLGAKSLDVQYSLSLRPIIESEVTLAAGVKVVGGITVGVGSTIGANGVVINNIPSGVVAVGVPAKPLREDKDET